MGLKQNLTPLDRIDSLKPDSLELLRKRWITTVEELVGIVEADPEGTRKFLQLSKSQFNILKNDAMALMNAEVLEEFRKQKEKSYPLGALDPRLRKRKS